MAVETVPYIILMYALPPEWMEKLNNDVSFMILSLIIKVLILIIVLCINRFFGKKNYLQKLAWGDWLKFMCIPMFSMLVLLLLYAGNIQSYAINIAFMLLLGNIMIYYYVVDMGRYNEKKSEMLQREMQINNQIEMYENIQQIYEEQRHITHEFKNQLLYIQGLLHDEEYPKIKEYVDEIAVTSDKYINFVETPNKIVNTILNQEFRIAKSKKTAIVLKLQIGEQIFIEENALVIMLTNLLNNAIEACQELEMEDRVINFKLCDDEERLIVSCSNPVEKEVIINDGLVMTTKNNPIMHGYGLKNVKHIAEKYNGDIVCACEDNKFSYTIVFEKM